MGKLLGAGEIRELADYLDLTPTKKWGQNFVVDANSCQRIVSLSQITPEDHVVEIGPGLGSLSLAILEISHHLTAIEIDKRLADLLPHTVGRHEFDVTKLSVINIDGMELQADAFGDNLPTALVANLPYNVSVPILLHFLELFPSIKKGIVMVQSEVADRLTAIPGRKDYGAPSLKGAWWADLAPAGNVSRSIFWPVPNVDSKLVSFIRHEPLGSEELRLKVFSLIDAAFSQRRKMLRSSLSSVISDHNPSEVMTAAGIDPTLRGEALTIHDFISIANAWN
jgi:16S rRNA (adenine1518-N6/adenine1519-N6)-dimethyltransferase